VHQHLPASPSLAEAVLCCCAGFEYCRSHILEDPNAPYKHCDHVTRDGKFGDGVCCKRPVPLDADDTRFCFYHKKKFGFLSGGAPTKKKEAPKQHKLVVAGPQVLAGTGAAGSEPQVLPLPPKMDDLWGMLVSKVPRAMEAVVDFKGIFGTSTN